MNDRLSEIRQRLERPYGQEGKIGADAVWLLAELDRTTGILSDLLQDRPELGSLAEDMRERAAKIADKKYVPNAGLGPRWVRKEIAKGIRGLPLIPESAAATPPR